MRIALLADIHGNPIALDAVLTAIEDQGGADGYWILGDFVALGPDPVGVLERINKLQGLRTIRGNTDRYVISGDRPAPSLQAAANDPSLLPALIEVANTFAWTQGMITAAGYWQWLQDLPVELTLSLPDGTRFLGVHASPGLDDGTGIPPEMADNEIEKLIGACDAKLIAMGHTHLPLNSRWQDIHLVNPGAVSLTLTPDKQAHYALLTATPKGYSIEHHRVAYNRQAVIHQLNKLQHPGRAFLIRHLSDPS